ncbi:metal ABC transporter permease [Paenibacillus sp.]|uniref:metal ABC transporter permease n=1 Tax=Paenibacillus sp. TaxID=58172 RepID=UPI002D2E2E93|nr:metal ABC transporter permease [Paenibacillus sp.]HZG57585.1 metal ABC transporter permease [Paenibacillus sp.]
MLLLELLRDPNIRWILLATTLLGLSSGVLGSFAYLRKQSLMGDALSHAALPGVCIAFMLTGIKSLWFFMVGAAVAGAVATFGIGFITRHSRIKQDAALAIVLSAFFGLGIMLLTRIQQSGSGSQAGLDKFLFGQAAAMIQADVYTMAGLAAFLVAACALFFKHFKLISFDAGFARMIGYPTAALEQLLMLLLVIAVVVGIQAVGVVLMAAMLITPAVAARYWTDRLGGMVVLAGVFGAASGALGTFASTAANKLPTGPLAVLAATAIFVVSVLFAPQRGLVAKRLRQAQAKRDAHRVKASRVGAPEKGVSA